jgi:hypothetical protein
MKELTIQDVHRVAQEMARSLTWFTFSLLSFGIATLLTFTLPVGELPKILGVVSLVIFVGVVTGSLLLTISFHKKLWGLIDDLEKQSGKPRRIGIWCKDVTLN